MKTLITGGAGFIGSHLVEELLKRDEEVFILDDLSTGRYQNIESFDNYQNFHCIIETILNEKIVEDLIKQCDRIYHLAASVGVKLIAEEPTRTIETNILGTETILKLASRYHRKVLLSSSSEVYGKSYKDNFNENDDCIIGSTKKHRWAYAASKMVDEFLALAYWNEKNLPVIIVRLFNIIGPRQTGKYGMVVPRFVNQALNGDYITIYGDGRQTRCFAYIKDVIHALIDLMENQHAVGNVFNIGSTEEISIYNLALLIKKLTGSSSEIKYVPYDRAYIKGFEDMRRRVPDIKKIYELTGFKPKTTLKESLKAIINDTTSKSDF